MLSITRKRNINDFRGSLWLPLFLFAQLLNNYQGGFIMADFIYFEDLFEQTIGVDLLDEASIVYKAAEFGATMVPATAVNYLNQKKLIKEVVKNSKSDKEAIEKLNALKPKFKKVKTWRMNHGNVIPIADKYTKARICQKAIDAIDKEIDRIKKEGK